MRKFLLVLGIVLVSISSLIFWARTGDPLTRDALVTMYPNVGPESKKEENKKILCPFLRLLNRAGLVGGDEPENNPVDSNVLDITKAAQTFGCGSVECGLVAAAVSAAQKENIDSSLGMVALTKLHTAKGVAHDCGFTFSKGGTEVSDELREKHLKIMESKADEQGRLSYDDLIATKLDICKAQGVEISKPGLTEVKLIYAYLGGVDRGFIDVADIRKLLHAEMPEFKTEHWIRIQLFKELDELLQH